MSLTSRKRSRPSRKRAPTSRGRKSKRNSASEADETKEAEPRTYRIELRPAARRQLRKLTPAAQKHARDLIDGLAKQPRPPGVETLSSNLKVYRVREGDYRVVYQVHDRVLLVLVVRVGDRRDVYVRVDELLNGLLPPSG